MMKLRLAQPSVLIDIGRLSDLSYIRDGGDHIAIGALTRHMDVETSRPAEGARAAAGPRRRRGRRPAGASPRHDRWHRSPTPTRPPTFRPPRWPSAPPTSPRVRTARREIAAADFYQTFFESALNADEMLDRDPRAEDERRRLELPEVQPARPGLGHRRRRRVARQRQFRRRARQHGVGADPGHQRVVGRCRAARRSRRRRRCAVAEAEPQADLNASVEYRTHLAKVLTRRALEAATN